MAQEIFNAFWHGCPLPPLQWACLASFVKLGHQLVLYTYDDLEVPPGVVVRDASMVLPRDSLFLFKNQNAKSDLLREADLGPFSDLFRFRLLSLYGGWWVDADVLCLSRKFPACDYAWACEQEETASIGSSQLRLPAGDVLAETLFSECLARSKSMTYREAIGPKLVTEVLGAAAPVVGHVGSTETFYPVRWIEVFKMWLCCAREEVELKIRDAYFISCYNSLLDYVGIDLTRAPVPGSFMEAMYSTLCTGRFDNSRAYNDEEILILVCRWLDSQTWAWAELSTVTGNSFLNAISAFRER